MAMNKTTLANAIVTALKAENPNITGDAETDLIAQWEILADKVIAHIQTFAQVSVSTTVSVASVTGVTPGGGASGPGTGTGTGTGTIA